MNGLLMQVLGNVLDAPSIVSSYGFNVLSYVEFFPNTPGGAGFARESYAVPRAARMLMLCCIGAGGPGGLGRSDSAGTARGGGGGGKGGALTIVLIPTLVLPSRLMVRVGSADSLNDNATSISVAIRTADNFSACYAPGGGKGTNGGSPAGGAGGIFIAGYQGMFEALAVARLQNQGSSPGAGGAGTTPSPGGSVTFPLTVAANTSFGGSDLTLPGAGGGGVSAAGTTAAGGSVGSTSYEGVLVPGGTAGGGKGGDGQFISQSQSGGVVYGGGGGGSINSGTGGAGGKGAFPGGGGGGGGAGTTGGAGGLGGSGFAFILAL